MVIGRFVTRDVSNLKCICLEDGTSFTGTTTHPIWSVDASDWKRLDELVVGESVKTLDGTLRITEIKRVQTSSDVFNIEVNSDHVYRLLDSGVIVHNANYADLEMKHILEGEFVNGVPQGFHHAKSGNGNGEIITNTIELIPDNPFGVYKAKAKILNTQTGKWVKKPHKTTFFPDDWDTAKVLDEIEFAWQNSVPDPLSSTGGRIGTGASGMEIYLVPRKVNGVKKVHTAYPHIP